MGHDDRDASDVFRSIFLASITFNDGRERVSIVVISDQLYSYHFVYRAICHFTGKIVGSGRRPLLVLRSKFETLPFPTSIPSPPSSDAFSLNSLFISLPRGPVNVPSPRSSRSRFAFRLVSLFLAPGRCLSPTPVPPTLPFTSRLWILLSNTYVARAAAARFDVCVRGCVRAVCSLARTRACARRRVHARWQRTQANGKARVLISIFDASRQPTSRGLSFPFSEKGNNAAKVSGRRDERSSRGFLDRFFFYRDSVGILNLVYGRSKLKINGRWIVLLWII